jgi:hypothetical protein
MKSIVSAALAYGYAPRQQILDEWPVKLPGAAFQGTGRPTAEPLTRNRIVSVASPSTTAAAHGCSRAAGWTAVEPTAAHAKHLRLSRGPSPDPLPA